ncbi:MAG: glycoside hydrolase family 25 protein [Bacteriovorax sp.]|nr:glycoside hydrolase family 25 protein [Bacteriovorax sp.]
MKHKPWPWKAFFLMIFTLLNIFTATYSYASGAKLPKIADETVIADTTDNAIPSTGGGTTTTPIPAPITGGTQSNFSSPWNKSGTSIVIDAFEGNSIDWDKMATDKKVVGVIHRSSIGLRVDTQYKARKKIALGRGYLWGAYHLGYKGNTIAQADLFISLIGDEPNTLMILDLENTSSGSLMTINEAVVFMDHVHTKTGRIPTVYANHSTTLLLNNKVRSNPLFQQSKLWYARFKSNLTDFPSGVWPNYFLWQFSSELNCSTTGSCLYNVPGTKFDMDVNVFNGSASDLEAKWNND